MKEKCRVRWWVLVVVPFSLLLVAGCALRPEPISKHDFGEVYVGTTAGSSPVRWRNHGSGALEVVGLLVLPLGGAFNLQSTQPFQSFVLQSGSASNDFTFTFAPTAAGAVSGEAIPQLIRGKGTVQALELEGTGVYQVARGGLVIGGGQMTTGQVLDFGSVLVPGGAPSQRRFNLINIGNQPVQVNIVWSDGNKGFSVVKPPAPITVPARDRVRVTLQFAPSAVGKFADGVTFVDVASAQNKAGTAVQGEGIARD